MTEKTDLTADVRSVQIQEIIYFLSDTHLVIQPLSDFPEYASAGINSPREEPEKPSPFPQLEFYFGKSRNTHI